MLKSSYLLSDHFLLWAQLAVIHPSVLFPLSSSPLPASLSPCARTYSPSLTADRSRDAPVVCLRVSCARVYTAHCQWSLSASWERGRHRSRALPLIQHFQEARLWVGRDSLNGSEPPSLISPISSHTVSHMSYLAPLNGISSIFLTLCLSIPNVSLAERLSRILQWIYIFRSFVGSLSSLLSLLSLLRLWIRAVRMKNQYLH